MSLINSFHIIINNIIDSISNNNNNNESNSHYLRKLGGSEDSLSFVSMQASIAFIVIFVVIVISIFMRPFLSTRIMQSQYQPL
jgi:hypothetical protein